MIRRLIEWYIHTPEHKQKYKILRAALKFVDGRTIRSRYGVLMRSESWDNTNFYAVSGPPKLDYEDVYAEVSQLRPGMAFLDVGANAGLFSMVAAKILNGTGPVIAFEPSLDNFYKLIHNAALNKSGAFYPFRVAIGGETRLANFSEEAGHSGKAHLDAAGSTAVLQTRFADLFPLIRGIVADKDVMIKIDVEGAEGIVVASLGEFLDSPRVRKVIVEIDPQYLTRFGSTVEELYARMAAASLTPRYGLSWRNHFNEVFERT